MVDVEPGLEEERRPPRGGRLVYLIPVLAVLFIVSLIRLPYFVLRPGPAEDVETQIHVSGRQTYRSQGHMLLTSISYYRPTAYQALVAWLDPAQAVVSEGTILGPGQSEQQELQVARSQMDTSKIDAAVIALTRYAGYPDRHGSGLLVENVYPDTPAEGKLFPGDVISRIDGSVVDDPDRAGDLIRKAGVGGRLSLTVEAAGKTRRVVVTPSRLPNVDHPAIGVSLVDNFPFDLTIDSGGIGGPSGGLMWTLGLVDLLTPGDMTGGRIVAGTGEITPEGKVVPIGGIAQKVAAAERAGASIFFVPIQNAEAARAVANRIVLVPVSSYLEALAYLERTS
jgi:PDZ domain-containing protein